MSIDLAITYGDSPLAVSDKTEPVKHYPTIHYEGPEDLNLPDEGEMTVKYKVVETTESERNGKKTYRCTIEIQSIEEVNEGDDDDANEAPSKNYDDASSALDKLVAAMSKSGK